jgi:hypothetical protein
MPYGAATAHPPLRRGRAHSVGTHSHQVEAGCKASAAVSSAFTMAATRLRAPSTRTAWPGAAPVQAAAPWVGVGPRPALPSVPVCTGEQAGRPSWATCRRRQYRLGEAGQPAE